MIFTYGQAHAFSGGWTEVEAPDPAACLDAFRMYHPGTDKMLLQCGGVYRDEDFRKTDMFVNGNFGKRCVERIKITHELVEEKQE